jgi:hypothetical protein
MLLFECLIAAAVALVTHCFDCFDDSSAKPLHPSPCESGKDACFMEYFSLVHEGKTVKDYWNRFCTYSLECRMRGLDEKCLKLHQLPPKVQDSFWTELETSQVIRNRSSVRHRDSYFCCCTSPPLCNDMNVEQLAKLQNGSGPATYFPPVMTGSFAISLSCSPSLIYVLNLLLLCLQSFVYSIGCRTID